MCMMDIQMLLHERSKRPKCGCVFKGTDPWLADFYGIATFAFDGGID